jgi:hypothetical protein
MPKANEQIIDKHDQQILRRLALRVAELAARPIESHKRDLWYRHNSLNETRPIVFCDPENGWNEIIKQSDLECRNVQARIWEMRLRREIFWGEHICDDRVIQPFFDVAHVFSETDWGMSAKIIGDDGVGSFIWDPPLKTYQDIENLRFPKIQVDELATQKCLAQAKELFDDILTVRLKTDPGLPTRIFWTVSDIPDDVWWWSLGLTFTLTYLRGLEQINYDFFDYPQELHSLMAFLRDGYLSKIDYLQENGLFSLNNDGTYVGSGGFGWTHELPQPDYQDKVRASDMWGFSESQETVGISPAMFAEYILPYQIPLLERFGLNCYGCCEPLDERWIYIEKIPRLRRVSVSPWSNIANMAEKLGNNYIFSMKAHPTDISLPDFDEKKIRMTIRSMFRQTRDCRVELILKDTHTIAKDPNRVIRWVAIALEEARAL